jgi:Golgi apparatus protein 1
MSPECKAEVVRDQNRMAQDYRLNWRLKTACKSDIVQLCDGLCNDKEGQMCGGVVLQCLQVSGALF